MSRYAGSAREGQTGQPALTRDGAGAGWNHLRAWLWKPRPSLLVRATDLLQANSVLG
jgi:hypothetical protein